MLIIPRIQYLWCPEEKKKGILNEKYFLTTTQLLKRLINEMIIIW